MVKLADTPSALPSYFPPCKSLIFRVKPRSFNRLFGNRTTSAVNGSTRQMQAVGAKSGAVNRLAPRSRMSSSGAALCHHQPRTSTEPGLPSFAALRPLLPQVQGIKLTPEQTTALQHHAPQEGVTIHATLTIAGRAIDESWRNNPLRIMSPAEIRDILGLKDQCMVSLAGGEISIAPGGSITFWELARFAKDGLFAVKSTENIENISRMVDLQSTAVSSNLTVEQAFQLKRNAFNAQVMFTNLGPSPVRQHTRTPETRDPLGTMRTPWHRRRADPWSSHRQWLAAPHAHLPRANPGSASGFGRGTRQSLRDLTQFPKLGKDPVAGSE